MNYSTRMKIAAVLSLLLHAAGVALLRQSYEPRKFVPPAETEPIVLDLQPEAPPEAQPVPPRQLVDVAVPAEPAPPPTDRIAEVNAETLDVARHDAERPAPTLDQDDYDALPKPAEAPVQPVQESAPPQEEMSEAESKDERDDREEPQPEVKEAMVRELVPERKKEAPAEEAPDGPIKIAQATMPQRPEAGKSRERGGVSTQGQTNVEAIQSDIAPYLKHVRTKVEQQWNQMLYTRYSGTSPVETVIDCAINAQGELVSVTVVGTDKDRLYSALCRDAVQRAGPFGAFPFEVPDIYRGKDLEIRWTFSFMVRKN